VKRFASGVEPAGKVARIQDKGVVVDLGDDIEGFVPASHTTIEDAARLPEYFRAGEPLDLRVIESDAANRRIVLEVTTVPERIPVKEVAPPEGEEAVPAEGEEAVPVEVTAGAAEGVERAEEQDETSGGAADEAQG
jgi:small subunit ribosomal protein S1